MHIRIGVAEHLTQLFCCRFHAGRHNSVSWFDHGQAHCIELSLVLLCFTHIQFPQALLEKEGRKMLIIRRPSEVPINGDRGRGGSYAGEATASIVAEHRASVWTQTPDCTILQTSCLVAKNARTRGTRLSSLSSHSLSHSLSPPLSLSLPLSLLLLCLGEAIPDFPLLQMTA